LYGLITTKVDRKDVGQEKADHCKRKNGYFSTQKESTESGMGCWRKKKEAGRIRMAKKGKQRGKEGDGEEAWRYLERG